MPRQFKWMSEFQKTKDLHHRGRVPSVAHFDEMAEMSIKLAQKEFRDQVQAGVYGEHNKNGVFAYVNNAFSSEHEARNTMSGHEDGREQ